jgi:hypothetical protein
MSCFTQENASKKTTWRGDYTKLYNDIKALVKQVMWFVIAVC